MENATDRPGAGEPAREDGSAVTSPMAGLRTWSARHPTVGIGVGLVLLLIGGLVFVASTGERNLFVSVLLAVVSAGVGAVGMLLVNEPIAGSVRRNRRTGLVFGLVVVAGGLVAAIGAVAVRSSPLVIVAVVVVIVGLLALNAWLTADDRAARGFLWPGLVLLVVGTILALIGEGIDAWALLGAGAWTLGLVLFKVGLPPWIDVDRASRRGRALVGSVAAIVLGVLLLYLSSAVSAEVALLAGIGLVVAGPSALGIALARYEPGRVLALVVVAAGLVLLAGGTWLTWRTLRLPELVLLGVAVLAAIGAWFVFRGEALMAALLIGFVVAWALVDRTTDAPVEPNPDGELTVLAFGDSFISGEGATRYFPGTNLPGVGNNACRRAPTAYPWLVADRLDAGLIFLACSGAKTVDMDGTPEPRPLPDPLPELPGGEDQVERLLASYGDRVADVDLVLVSIGGNDVYFGNIVQACLLPQTCAVDDRTGPWLANARAVEDTLVDTYTLLRDVVGADTPIVAMAYPQVVRPVDGCRTIIGRDEIDFVVEFTDTLDTSIRRAAARAGINVYDGSVDAFAGRGLCDDDPATNSLHLSPTEGPFTTRISPANWVHGSMHPRDDGHRLIADGLVAPAEGDGAGDGAATEGFLVDLLASVADGGPANPDPDPDAGGVPVPPVPPEVPDRDWVEERLYETVAALVPPVGLLLVGGLVAAYGLIRLDLPGIRFLKPANDEPAAPTS